MIERDILVAVVAFGLGAFIIHSAATSKSGYLEFWLVKALESRLGRNSTRLVVSFVGALIVLLGIYVLASPGKTQRSFKSRAECDFCVLGPKEFLKFDHKPLQLL